MPQPFVHAVQAFLHYDLFWIRMIFMVGRALFHHEWENEVKHAAANALNGRKETWI